MLSLSAVLKVWWMFAVEDSIAPCIYRSHIPLVVRSRFSIISLSFMSFSSLNKVKKLRKQLLIVVCKLLDRLFKSRVCKLACCLIALCGHEPDMAECVFDIKQFFRCHILFLRFILRLSSILLSAMCALLCWQMLIGRKLYRIIICLEFLQLQGFCVNQKFNFYISACLPCQNDSNPVIFMNLSASYEI